MRSRQLILAPQNEVCLPPMKMKSHGNLLWELAKCVLNTCGLCYKGTHFTLYLFFAYLLLSVHDKSIPFPALLRGICQYEASCSVMTRNWIVTKHHFRWIWIASETHLWNCLQLAIIYLPWAVDRLSIAEYILALFSVYSRWFQRIYSRYVWRHCASDTCFVALGSRIINTSVPLILARKQTLYSPNIYYVVRFWIINRMPGSWQ